MPTNQKVATQERIDRLNEQIYNVHVLFNNAMNMRKRDGSITRLEGEWDALLRERRQLEAAL